MASMSAAKGAQSVTKLEASMKKTFDVLHDMISRQAEEIGGLKAVSVSQRTELENMVKSQDDMREKLRLKANIEDVNGSLDAIVEICEDKIKDATSQLAGMEKEMESKVNESKVIFFTRKF